jgi:uncharacterized membrane protein
MTQPELLGPTDPDTGERVRCIELLISNLLRFSVIASFLLIVGGTLLSFLHHPMYLTSFDALQHLTQPGAAFPHTLQEVLNGLKLWHGQAIVTLGLLLLIATPVMRVAISVFAFIYQKDRLFTFITLAVFSLLLLSFVLGKVE